MVEPYEPRRRAACDRASHGHRAGHAWCGLRSYEVYARVGDYPEALEQLPRTQSLTVLLDVITAVAAVCAQTGEKPSSRRRCFSGNVGHMTE